MAMDAANMASWIYDVRKDTFTPLYGETVSGKAMTMEGGLNMLHPQDRAPLKRLISQLINKEIQTGQMTLRFYNKQEQQYCFYVM